MLKLLTLLITPPTTTTTGNGSTNTVSLKDLYGKKVATLSRGDYFGEKALLADDVRQASCIAIGKVVCLSLSREDFIAMLGNWNEITEEMHNEEEENTYQDITKSNIKFPLELSNLYELEIINILGVGAFGKVKHVRHIHTKQEYALKVQAKNFIITQGMQNMLINEMNIMRTVNHSCIAKIFCAMQDTKFV